MALYRLPYTRIVKQFYILNVHFFIILTDDCKVFGYMFYQGKESTNNAIKKKT